MFPSFKKKKSFESTQTNCLNGVNKTLIQMPKFKGPFDKRFLITLFKFYKNTCR